MRRIICHVRRIVVRVFPGLSLTLLMAGPSAAGPIPVPNGTFDVINNPVNPAPISLGNAASGYVYTDYVGAGQTLYKSSGSTGPDSFDIPSWTSISNLDNAGVQLLGTNYVSPGTSSGLYAFIDNNNGGTTTIWQTLGDNLAPSTTYTLSASLARRTDQGDPGASFAVQLWAGSNLLLNNSPSLTTTFQDFSFTYTSPASGAAIGQPLMIQFAISIARQALIDNVTLFSAVPEPASLSLLALGGLALLRRRK